MDLRPFAWLDGRWHQGTELPDDPGASPGHFAIHRVRSGIHYFSRDRLGVHKLFFAIDPNAGPVSAPLLRDLIERGFSLDQIWSVPSGHQLILDPANQKLELRQTAPFVFAEEAAETVEVLGQRIREALDLWFARLAELLRGRDVWLTLSGGLDSSLIASLARRHLTAVRAITFARDDEEEIEGSDLHAARGVAAALGLPLEVERTSASNLLDLLDTVLIHGQDWRDFNVHCGLVNAALARGIRARAPETDAVVLTGDLMNELLADYTPVVYRGQTFYALPRLRPGRLRQHLVQGLDTGDREVGIFAAEGIEVIQPFALCAQLYADLPDALIEGEDAKAALVRATVGNDLPDWVYARPKVRAQVGSSREPRGTLALLADQGIYGDTLLARFADCLRSDPVHVRALIRAGFYRFPTTYPEPAC